MDNKQYYICIGVYCIFMGATLYIYKKFLDKLSEEDN